MPIQSLTNSFITTSSGIIGGVAKAVTSGFTICSISLPHVIDVAVYAAISASVGYSIKLGFDELRKCVNKRRHS